MPKAERVLTVQKRYRENEFRVKPYPEIRLAGNWLEIAGFQAGDKVIVKVTNGRLVVAKEREG